MHDPIDVLFFDSNSWSIWIMNLESVDLNDNLAMESLFFQDFYMNSPISHSCIMHKYP